MVKISPTIDAIKKETQNTLTSYFSDLSREFDTDFSGNVKDIAVFLAANANHPTDDIVKAFDLETPEALATMYANAAGSIKNDTHVAMMVFGSARKLGMNPEHLDLS